jgi:long-chain acyl-CoA synthetase
VDGTHVADLVTANAARVPEQPAVIDVTSGDTLTWAQLDEAVSAEADRVSARVSRPATAWSCGWATARRSASRCSGPPRGRGRGAARPGRRRGGARRRVRRLPPGARRRGRGRRHRPGLRGHRRRPVVPPPDLAARAPGRPGVGAGEDIALLVYASGTTGVPRGIQLSHRALLANRAQTAALRPAPVTPVDRVLLSLPALPQLRARGGLPAGVLGGRHRGARRAARARSRSPTSSSRSG